MYCSNCGNKVSDSDKFCGNCGKKIEVSMNEKNKEAEGRKLGQRQIDNFFRKKSKVIYSIVFCMAIFMFGLLFFMNSNRNTEKGITRYEWVKLLATEFGIEASLENDAYFEDVNHSNEYFGYVQALVEWNILQDKKVFSGEDMATGEFIAVTALKALGEHKIQLFLGNDSTLNDNEYIKLAYENEVIKKAQLKEYFTKEQSIEVIKKTKELSYLLWKDDYENIVYVDNVLELEGEELIEYDEMSSTLQISEKSIDRVDVGTVIVFEQNGLKIAKKVEEIDEQGNILTSIPEIEEIIKSLELSDIASIGFEDVVKYYGFDERDIVTDVDLLEVISNDENLTINTGIHDFRKQSNGFSLYFVSKDDEIRIVISDLDRKVAYKLPLVLDVKDYKKQDDEGLEMELEACYDIRNIDIGGQLIWNKGVEYTCLGVNADVTEKISAKIKMEELPLFEIPIPLGNGLVSAKIKISLDISTGGVKMTTERPVGMHVLYDREVGVRNTPIKNEYSQPQIEVSDDLEVVLGSQFILMLGKNINILDAKVDTGVSANVEVTEHETQTCVDINMRFPIITLSVMDDKDTILREIIGSFEWNIISEEEANLYNKHFESYTDATKESQFVDSCTYEIETEKNIESDNEVSGGIERFYGYDLPLAFSLDYTYDENSEYGYNEFFITDEGDYYLVQGTLICPECVTTGIDTRKGKTFISGNGFEYRVLGEESYNNDQRQKILLEGEDGEEYEILNMPAFQYDAYTGATYYVISAINGTHYKTAYENVKLRIDKDTYFTDINGDKGNMTFEYAVDNGWFEDVSYSLGYDIHFTEDGRIDVLSALDIESNGVPEWYGPECEKRIGVLE